MPVQLIDLPSELLDGILELVLGVPIRLFDHPLPSRFEGYKVRSISSSVILEVCKLFRDIGQRHLYETVILRSHWEVVALLKALRQEVQSGDDESKQKHKSLSSMIRKVRVEYSDNASVIDVLRMCGHVTHLWVNIRAWTGLDESLKGMKITHLTVWDVHISARWSSRCSSARSQNISALRDMVVCSTSLESFKYHRDLEFGVGSTDGLLSGVLSSSTLKTIILPLRPLPARLDRDYKFFPRLQAMKSLVELRLISDQYSIEDIRSGLALATSLGKLTVAFDISDPDVANHVYSYRSHCLNLFDWERDAVESRGRTETTPLDLLIDWYAFGSKTRLSKGGELESVSLVDRQRSRSSRTRSRDIPTIKPDYRAFTGFLRRDFLKLRRLKWKTSGDPFREGTTDAVTSGLENCLPMLEFLDYQSNERLFLDTLCTMSLPQLVEVRLRHSEYRAGFELFLWIHGHKLLRLEIGLGDHVKGLLSAFCTNLEVLTIRVPRAEMVDLRNFEEVGIHKKLKRIHILHEGGSPKQIEEQLAFVVALDPKPYPALEAIQLQCRWPSVSRWNLENNFFVRLAEYVWNTRKIKVLDESGRAWNS